MKIFVQRAALALLLVGPSLALVGCGPKVDSNAGQDAVMPQEEDPDAYAKEQDALLKKPIK